MENESMVRKIKDLAYEKDISLALLERTLNFSNGSIARWDKSSPSVDKVDKVAKYFNVSLDYLLGQQATRQTQPKKGIKIPVLGQVEAGLPIEAVENIIDEEEISEELARTGEFFGLQVHGHSMEPPPQGTL